MSPVTCAKCAAENDPAARCCTRCGLPFNSPLPDNDPAVANSSEASFDPPDTATFEAVSLDLMRVIHDFAVRSGFELHRIPRHGYRLTVQLPNERHQAVYIGHIGADRENRPTIGLISVCGTVNDRDCRSLLKQNAITVDGHFAIKTLRGEDYFVYVLNITADYARIVDAHHLVRRIAETADQMEQRLSRGKDVF